MSEGEFLRITEKNNPIVWDVEGRAVVLRDDLGPCRKRPELKCVEDNGVEGLESCQY
ncbi:hypothetical protein [Sulfodiicoccus acidiphilus]|uniref:hypothetical protein n=1 Tax=Sulfodiicoccus acidiphilus TaxID=1670455 RepID=UPI00131584F6|nr:hypothetical protein [Sulfodiicoccus acidiphilus]